MKDKSAGPVASMKPAEGTLPSRFRGFDGLRGIAILSVITYHGILTSAYPTALLGTVRPLLLAGWSGVDLFFALSGFLITSLLLREGKREAAAGRPKRFNIGRFYLRRAFRILPAFYAVLLLDVFLFSRFSQFTSVNVAAIRHSPVGFWPYGTFWANYMSVYGARWFGPAVENPGGAFQIFWSLCVEEHFYLLWPLFLLLVRSTQARVATAVTLGVALALLRYLVTVNHWDIFAAVHCASHYRLDSILWGGTAAILSGLWHLSDRWRRLLIGIGGAVILLLIFTNTMAVVPAGRPLGVSLGFSLLSLVASLLLLELVAKPGTWLARALEFRPLVAVGKVSYGMYLLHVPMMDVGMVLLFAVPRRPTPLNLVMALVLFAVLTYAAAWLLYQIVERTFLIIKDRHFR